MGRRNRDGMIHLTIHEVMKLKTEGLEHIVLVEVQQSCYAPYKYVKMKYKGIAQFLNSMYIPLHVVSTSVNDNLYNIQPLSEIDKGRVMKILTGE